MAEHRRERPKDVDEETSSAVPIEEEDTTLLPEETGFPPEEAWAAEDYGTTVTEERRGEPLSERLRREIPDMPPSRRPAEPDRLATSGFAGRLVSDNGLHAAESDVEDYAAEEVAMHLVSGRRRDHHLAQPGSHGDRLDLLEAQVTVLLTLARVHTEALVVLAEALERSITERPESAADTVRGAAQRARDLLSGLPR